MKKGGKFLVVLVAMMLFSGIVTINMNFAIAESGGISATTGWSVSEAATGIMTISGESARGVGKISYSAAPEVTTEGYEFSVSIPITGYVAGTDNLSIKYKTNIELEKMRLYAKCEGVTDPSLFALLNGWNVKQYQTKDGNDYCTISGISAVYLNQNIMTNLYVAFDTSATAQTFTEEQYFEFMGIEFPAAAADVPSFVSDPVIASLGDLANEATSTRYVVNKTLNGTNVKYTGKGDGRLETSITNWSKIYTQLVLTIAPMANTKLDVYADGVKLTDYNNVNGIFATNAKTTVYFDIPSTVTNPQKVALVFDPNIEGYEANSGETTVVIESFEIISAYSQSKLVVGQGLKMTTENDNTVIKFAQPGWGNLATLTLNNYNKTYDTLVLKIVPRANMVLGIRAFDTAKNEVYFRNHYAEESIFKTNQETTLMYFDIDQKFAAPLSYIEFWFDATADTLLEKPNKDETTVIIKRLELIQSFLMPNLPITAQDKTVDFNGEEQEIVGANEQGLSLVSYYKPDVEGGAFTINKPIHGGRYLVETRFLGNETYKYSYATAVLTINKIAAPAPTEALVTFDYVKGTMNFAAGAQVCLADDFVTLIETGAVFTEGATYNLRTAENSDYFTSSAITFTTVTRSDVVVTSQNIVVEYNQSPITATATASQEGEITLEYKLKSEPDTAYSIAAPTNVGEYDVKITYKGNNLYRTNVMQIDLTINKRVALTPTIAAITINYTTETLSYDDANFVVAIDDAFKNIVLSGEEFVKGGTLFIKQLANDNELQSAVASVTMPRRVAVAPTISVDYKNERTVEAINTNIEYKVGDSNWIRGAGEFITLIPDTVYQFRVRATANAFASERQELNVPKRPNKPHAVSCMSATTNCITIVAVEGYEYKRGEGEWQDSNIFEGLDANTEYTFYARKKSSDTSFNSLQVTNQISTLATAPKKGCGSVAQVNVSIIITLICAAVCIVLLNRSSKKKEIK